MEQKVFINYHQDGVLADAYQVFLEDETATYGIARTDGTVEVPAGTVPDHPSLGVYEYILQAQSEITYKITWKIFPNQGDQPTYVFQEVGPFFEASDNIRAVADVRGLLIPGQKSVLFLMITDLDGNAADPTDVNVVIVDENGSQVVSAIPEKAAKGFYAYDWAIDSNQAAGEYNVTWDYVVDTVAHTELQEVVIAGQEDTPNNFIPLYQGRVAEMRMALTAMIRSSMQIPVYNEPAKVTTDFRTYRFTFPRWNQSAGARIMRNDIPVTSSFSINYFKGEVVFDRVLTKYDRINAYYNFRWFTDEELDRFLSNGLHLFNYYPAVSDYHLLNIEDRFIPIVLWGAAVEALRHLMLDITFQEPALVFGNAEAAQRAFANFDATKKNYEDMLNKALDVKKYARNYVGLTRSVTTPEFALPGGRSRWFRYLFTSS